MKKREEAIHCLKVAAWYQVEFGCQFIRLSAYDGYDGDWNGQEVVRKCETGHCELACSELMSGTLRLQDV